MYLSLWINLFLCDPQNWPPNLNMCFISCQLLIRVSYLCLVINVRELNKSELNIFSFWFALITLYVVFYWSLVIFVQRNKLLWRSDIDFIWKLRCVFPPRQESEEPPDPLSSTLTTRWDMWETCWHGFIKLQHQRKNIYNHFLKVVQVCTLHEVELEKLIILHNFILRISYLQL